MKRVLKWVALVLCALAAAPVLAILCVIGYYYSIVHTTPGALKVNVTPGELGALVNPFIGTGGWPWMCGLDTPAATTPFGMVRLGPDTASFLKNMTGLNRSGYFYGDNKIIGFSHTRLVGADSLEGGVFRVLPTVESRVEKLRTQDRFARFSHRDETAFPGYYAVRLPKDNVLVELTATPRVGVHRYTFPKNAVPHLLVDVTSKLGDKRCEEGVVTVLPGVHELEGKVKTFGTFSGRYGGLDVYFVARFSQPFAKYGTWTGTRFDAGKDGAAQVGHDDIGVDLGFAASGQEQVIEVRLGISCVSIANARKNLEAEADHSSFEQVAAAARDAWEKRLSLIRIEGGTQSQQRVFYTALYHAFQMPTVFNDVNGEYTGFDRAVHKADGFKYYTDFSLWDTFRTVHPLYNLIARDDERDMMVSLVEMAKAGGCLPRWPSGCGYTNCMFGTPADIAVTEAYLKGIRNFDVETAYKCMRQTGLTGKPESSHFGGRDGLDLYLKYGYCPAEIHESVAKTFEYGNSDYAISLLAEALGHKEDAETFAEHAKFYRRLFNPATQFFETKDDQGNFPKERDPLKLTYLDFKHKYTDGYVEGSAWQWRWGAPYDAEGLISLFSSREYFVSELDKFFAKSNPKVGQWNPGPYYWPGNEPDIHAVYLFNAAGRPDLTQKYVRRILDTKYTNSYYGLDGNDDGAALSSWCVLSALGFYPVAGTTKYQLGAPLFTKAELKFGDKKLTILAENNSAQNMYVQKVSLNNKPLDRTWFTHDELEQACGSAQGGTLRFEMAPGVRPGP